MRLEVKFFVDDTSAASYDEIYDAVGQLGAYDLEIYEVEEESPKPTGARKKKQ